MTGALHHNTIGKSVTNMVCGEFDATIPKDAKEDHAMVDVSAHIMSSEIGSTWRQPVQSHQNLYITYLCLKVTPQSIRITDVTKDDDKRRLNVRESDSWTSMAIAITKK